MKGEKRVNTTEIQKSAMPHPSSFYITAYEDIPVQWNFRYEPMKVQTNASGGGLEVALDGLQQIVRQQRKGYNFEGTPIHVPTTFEAQISVEAHEVRKGVQETIQQLEQTLSHMETDIPEEDEHRHEENVALFHLLSYLTKKTKKGTYIQAPKGAEEDGTLLRKDLLTVMNSNFGSQKHEWHNNTSYLWLRT